ncbi:MAG: YegS/Rv2252/BmrU family lipid kinase, partial [Clostridiales bacterium]|nr:YegS/Rv2252/BmrU family lipid kinase [Clostridiales bacterium]
MAGRKRMLLIINPKSGRGQIRSRLLEALDVFTKNGWRVQVYVTQRPLDARDMAAKEGGHCDLIVCCGGDGTLNETVSGMMQLEKRPMLGYIPSGSTNDFASGRRLPRNVPDAAHTAVAGVATPVDIGSFQDSRYFVYVAGFGIFTEISYMTPQEKKNRLGRQAYLLESLKSLTSIRSCRMHVSWEDGELDGEFILGMVTNSKYVGGFTGLTGTDVQL